MDDNFVQHVAEAIRLEAEYKTGDSYFLRVVGGREKPLYKELAKAAIEAVNSYKHLESNCITNNVHLANGHFLRGTWYGHNEIVCPHESPQKSATCQFCDKPINLGDCPHTSTGIHYPSKTCDTTNEQIIYSNHVLKQCMETGKAPSDVMLDMAVKNLD